jgi:hypothetical protein
VAGAQAIAWIVEGLAYAKTEPHGIAGDLWHRLGFPFLGAQSTVALLLLLVGVVLMSLRALMGEQRSEQQEALVRVALVFAIAIAVTVALGSVLGVRANLHVLAAQGRGIPTYVRVEMTSFLLGVIGAAAVALFSAVAALGLHGNRG